MLVDQRRTKLIPNRTVASAIISSHEAAAARPCRPPRSRRRRPSGSGSRSASVRPVTRNAHTTAERDEARLLAPEDGEPADRRPERLVDRIDVGGHRSAAYNGRGWRAAPLSRPPGHQALPISVTRKTAAFKPLPLSIPTDGTRPFLSRRGPWSATAERVDVRRSRHARMPFARCLAPGGTSRRPPRAPITDSGAMSWRLPGSWNFRRRRPRSGSTRQATSGTPPQRQRQQHRASGRCPSRCQARGRARRVGLLRASSTRVRGRGAWHREGRRAASLRFDQRPRRGVPEVAWQPGTSPRRRPRSGIHAPGNLRDTAPTAASTPIMPRAMSLPVPGTSTCAGTPAAARLARRGCGAWHREGHRAGGRPRPITIAARCPGGCLAPGTSRRDWLRHFVTWRVPGTGRDIASTAVHVRSRSRRDVPEVAWRLERHAGPRRPS